MSQPLDRAALRELLQRPNLHDFVDAADARREAAHGRRTTFVAAAHLDAGSGRMWCPLTGERAPADGFPTDLQGLSDEASDLVIVVKRGITAAELETAWEKIPTRPSEPGLATVQMGTTDTWIHALGADAAALKAWRERGLLCVSDGLRPRVHPLHGAESAQRWTEFWRAAAGAGLKGHAVVLYGPHHGLDDVFAQIDAIAGVQDECGVFLSVAPVIYDPAGADGPDHALSTHASLDLRVMAACRLGLPQIPHLSLRYDSTDLKSAHTALLCGVDDLVGHLFLGRRDRKADAEAQDLSLDEMQRWLNEAGFAPVRRNALFEEIPLGSSR